MPHLRSAWLNSSSVMKPLKSLSMVRNMRRAVTECSRIFSLRLFSTKSICESGHTCAVPSITLSEYSSALSMTSCWPFSVTVPPTYRSPATTYSPVSGFLYLPDASHLPPTMPLLRTGGSNTDSVSSASEKPMMKRRLTSMGRGFANFATKRSTLPSFSISFTQSFFGGFGTRYLNDPSESSSLPKPVGGGGGTSTGGGAFSSTSTTLSEKSSPLTALYHSFVYASASYSRMLRPSTLRYLPTARSSSL
mmetsp:Transcript_22425/g.78595  ORF Transcript_22425/g.78595 Transcript_22425/m.78595 type:complete len:249 (+) Transcript_22425:757-1503(+)